MLVMLIHDQCLLQGSRNMWHLYTTEKYSCLDINHCFQYFTQAATLGTLLQLTKFLKTEIIKKKKKSIIQSGAQQDNLNVYNLGFVE